MITRKNGLNTYRYSNYVAFPSFKKAGNIPNIFFCIAVLSSFIIANMPPKRISQLIRVLINKISLDSSIKNFLSKSDFQHIHDSLLDYLFIPLKGFLFFIALLTLLYPIIICIYNTIFLSSEKITKSKFISALIIFIVLSLLSFPYTYPYGLNSHPSGLAGIGVMYGEMSFAPFSANSDWVYGRLLKPAIAYFIQMHGFILYYLFSLICTYILIWLTLVFFESKIFKSNFNRNNNKKNAKLRFWLYLSVMTSSYMMVNFQWPGYPEQLAFILILLMASIPMTRQARLATIALCLITHEGIAFALVPIILFCFPKREISKAFLIIGLYYGIFFGTYGFNLFSGLEAHGTFASQEDSTWQAVLENPIFALAGLFFAYKLFWFIFLYVVRMLWCQKDKATLLAIVCITVFPAFIPLIAWDTTRLTGFGFLGILISLAILIDNYNQVPKPQCQVLLTIILFNIFIPSYNIILDNTATLSYSYPGLYLMLHKVVSLVLN